MERREGDIRPKRQGGDRHSQRIEAHAELILSAVAAKSDITLAELRERLKERGVAVAIGTLWRFFKRHKRSRAKKNRARRRAGAPGRVKRREDWFEGQLELDPTRLVFIDETWASTKMARLYGRAAEGRATAALGVPHGHWKTTTFVAGLRQTGMTAPMVLDGPINGEAFLAYVEQALVPELRPGDIVIMDMCGRPRRCKKNLFEQRGAWSGADMCPASAAACHMPPARMGVRGAGPIQSRALKARIHDLVFPIPSR